MNLKARRQKSLLFVSSVSPSSLIVASPDMASKLRAALTVGSLSKKEDGEDLCEDLHSRISI